eukprot:3938845-Rhodomonas_salina.5
MRFAKQVRGHRFACRRSRLQRVLVLPVDERTHASQPTEHARSLASNQRSRVPVGSLKGAVRKGAVSAACDGKKATGQGPRGRRVPRRLCTLAGTDGTVR